VVNSEDDAVFGAVWPDVVVVWEVVLGTDVEAISLVVLEGVVTDFVVGFVTCELRVDVGCAAPTVWVLYNFEIISTD
jgi:hypothetical protein